jgi:hypothetical protein
MLLLMLFFIGSGVGSLVGGAFSLLSAGLTGASQGAAIGAVQHPATATANANTIQNRLSMAISQAGPGNTRVKALDTNNAVKQQISQKIAMGQDQEAVRIIVNNTGMSNSQAQNVVANSKLETREVAQKVTNTASKVVWWSFFGVLLSLLAAAIGGASGGMKRLNIRRAT